MTTVCVTGRSAVAVVVPVVPGSDRPLASAAAPRPPSAATVAVTAIRVLLRGDVGMSCQDSIGHQLSASGQGKAKSRQNLTGATMASDLADSVPPMAAQPISVLLVEDEASIAEPFAAALGKEGFVVTVVSTVTEARAAWERAASDVALIDVMLPDGDSARVRDGSRIQFGEDGPVLVLRLDTGGE